MQFYFYDVRRNNIDCFGAVSLAALIQYGVLRRLGCDGNPLGVSFFCLRALYAHTNVRQIVGCWLLRFVAIYTQSISPSSIDYDVPDTYRW